MTADNRTSVVFTAIERRPEVGHVNLWLGVVLKLHFGRHHLWFCATSDHIRTNMQLW